MPRVKVVSPSDGNLRALAVCRLRDSTLVAFFPVDSSESASIRATIGKVLEANAHGVHPRQVLGRAAPGGGEIFRLAAGVAGAAPGAPALAPRAPP